MPKPTPILAFRQPPTPRPAADIAIAPRATSLAPVATTPAVDLSCKPRVVFLIGSGGTGKTTLARYAIERGQGAGRQAACAALDPVNRTLANYVTGVAQPETADPVVSARFLREMLSFVMEGSHSAVIDLGGGDTTLAALLDEMPDLAAILDQAGMAAVALYTLAPRIDDLAPFLSLGFRPAATAFVCNMARAEGQARSFAPLLEHPTMREAIEAGARVVYMPRLDSDVVAQIESERMSFGTASRKLGPFASAQVRQWLAAMDRAFEPMGSWLP